MPLIDEHILTSLKIVHGLFNFLVILLFFYQGSMGLKIRRARTTGAPIPLAAVKLHRKNGGRFAGLGVLGFLAGIFLVFIDKGNILEYPLHFVFGLVIVATILTTLIISRRIKGPDSSYRTPHFILGVIILCLYMVQAFIGLGVLL